jgi:hypothetical protein
MKNLIYLSLLILFLFTACQKDGSIQADYSSTGKGGSTARFASSGDYLYTVNQSQLQVFDISNPTNPVNVANLEIGWGIETIFPYEDKLFIGTQTGMLVYDIADPINPKKLSMFEHVYSCDPVVVEGDYAYVTLHSEDNWCGQFNNELQIIDIQDIKQPKLIGTYNMINPLGLGIDGDILFICDKGLKVYDVSDKLNIKLLHYFDIEAADVIPYRNVLLVIGENGLYQYRYENNQLNLLSSLLTVNQ